MFREYRKGDYLRIEKQPEQDSEAPVDDELWDCKDTLVYEDNGEIYLIVRPYFEGGRVYISALVSAKSGEVGITLFRKMNRIIENWLACSDINRVEFMTQRYFEQANRLAELLGFTYEGTMRKYYNGIDFNMWGKVK